MSTQYPTYKLYDSTGISLVYTFTNVVDDDGVILNDGIDFAEHTGLRGVGSNIIPGSSNPFDFPLEFILIASGSTSKEKYEDLISKMQAIKTAITTGTKFILKIDEDDSTTIDLKVIRVLDIQFPLGTGQKRVNYQRVVVPFRTKAWS